MEKLEATSSNNASASTSKGKEPEVPKPDEPKTEEVPNGDEEEFIDDEDTMEATTT